jgi:hypothetical protein
MGLFDYKPLGMRGAALLMESEMSEDERRGHYATLQRERRAREAAKRPPKPDKPPKQKPGKLSPQEIAARFLEKVRRNERRAETSPLPGPRDPNGMGHHDRGHDQ